MTPELPAGKFSCILADPPWAWRAWGQFKRDRTGNRAPEKFYEVMPTHRIAALPVEDIAAKDCVLFLWATWPMLQHALRVIDAWGFNYKTMAFDWMKADVSTMDLFADPVGTRIGLGFWTRSNSEGCLLATRGKPKRLHRDVRMGVIEKPREHSRKPDCIYSRIERLVDGPRIELFARTSRPGWTSWGHETGKFRQGVQDRES